MEKSKFIAFRGTPEQADKLQRIQKTIGAKSVGEVLRLLVDRAEVRPMVVLTDALRAAKLVSR